MKQLTENKTFWAWLIWAIAAIFYGYEFFLRISPQVMIPQLMETFTASAAAIGLLSGTYYYAYAVMQIPVGLILDRYGPRISLILAAASVALGCELFLRTTSLPIAALGRIIMGVGSAFAFVGCLQLSAAWFPPKRFALAVGLTNAFGVLGALAGEAPLARLVADYGWRNTLHIAAFIGLFIALLNFLFIRNHPADWQKMIVHPYNRFKHRQVLRYLFRNVPFWMMACYGCLMVAPISGFSELWSVPFLGVAYHLSATKAAQFSSLIFVGIGFGGPINSLIAGRIDDRRLVMLLGTMLAFLSLMLIIYFPPQPLWLLAVLLFTFGFCTSSMLLCFTINVENNPNMMRATVIGLTNMVVMLGASLSQPLIGHLLDLMSHGVAIDGVRHFTVAQFRYAFLILPICQAVALVLLLKYQQQEEERGQPESSRTRFSARIEPR